MTEKLDTELDQGVIKQTRHKIKPIRFRNDGRSDKVKHLSRHSSEQILEAHYDKPSIDTIRGYAEKTSEVFNFIQRRSA